METERLLVVLGRWVQTLRYFRKQRLEGAEAAATVMVGAAQVVLAVVALGLVWELVERLDRAMREERGRTMVVTLAVVAGGKVAQEPLRQMAVRVGTAEQVENGPMGQVIIMREEEEEEEIMECLVLEALEEGAVEQEVAQLLQGQQQTKVGAVVEVVIVGLTQMVGMVAPALSLFAIHQYLLLPHPLRAHPQSQCQMAIVSIHSLVTAQSPSEETYGAFCKT